MKKRVLAMLLCIALMFSIPVGNVTAASDVPDNLSELMSPLWEGDTVYNESVLFADLGDGASASLLYPATEILSVQNAQLNITYEEGRDYIYKDGKLTLPAGSRIPYMTEAELYPSTPGNTMPKKGGGYIVWSEGTFFHERQTVVTYRHTSSWDGPLPYYDADKLPHTMQRLKSASPLSVVLYGDSISEGYNASGYTGIAPFMPSYGQLAVDWWEEIYGSDITYTNTAVAGMDTNWGVSNVESRVNAYNPDLVIIAFGMNDGGANMSPDTFRTNVQTMMRSVKSKNPNAEFILIAPMLPNPESTSTGTQAAFKAELDKLATGNDAIVVDMTAVHSRLMESKEYRDMTGNNINHPNDYLVRWYAQMVAYSLIDCGYKSLTVDTNYNDMANITVNGRQYSLPYTGTFQAGETVTVSLTPKDPDELFFSKWTSGASGRDHTIQVTMDADQALTAEFINMAPANLALNKPVTATSEISGWPASSLTDGVRVFGANYGYSSDGFNSPDLSSNPLSITVDLGSVQTFNRVSLYPRNDCGTGVEGASSPSFPSDFTIQVSTDGSSYTTVYTAVDQENPNGNPLKLDFRMTQARYVRLNVTKVGPKPADDIYYRLQLHEIEVSSQTPAPEQDLIVPEAVQVNESFVVTIVTDPDIDRLYLLNESGMKLGGVRSAAFSSDGKKVWTCTTSIGTAGLGRHITISVARKGETFFKHSAFDIDVLTPTPTMSSASFDSRSGIAGQSVNMTVTTDTLAAKLELFNESGLKIMTVRSGYTDRNGVRTWQFPVTIGTAGERVITVRAANSKGQYATTDFTAPLSLARAK